MVQWQGADGTWHDVDGWRGNLTDGTRRWWVAAKDYNTGPFRWQVSESGSGQVWGSSRPFNLPAASNQTVVVSVAATN